MEAKDRVYDLLKKNRRGLTIQELSNQLDTSRMNINLALAELKGAGLVEIREIGRAKLHYLKKKL